MSLLRRESRHSLLLGRSMGLDCSLDDAEALGRELDEDAPTVSRARNAADEVGPLEPIDTVGDGGGCQEERARQVCRAHPVRRAGPPKDAEHVVLVRVEVELVEDMLRRALDVSCGATDALDDGLGRDVQVGALAPPVRERVVDVILLPGNRTILARR